MSITVNISKMGFLGNITYLGSSCFRSCTSLTKVSFPNITSVPSSPDYSYIFYDTALTTIEVPTALLSSFKSSWSSLADKFVGI